MTFGKHDAKKDHKHTKFMFVHRSYHCSENNPENRLC